MVLQLLRGLKKGGEYDAVAAVIQQTKPLPTFDDEARSQLILEETRRAKQQDDDGDTTFFAANPTQHSGDMSRQQQPPQQQPSRGAFTGRGSRGGRASWRGGRGRGRGGRYSGHFGNQYDQSQTQVPWASSPWLHSSNNYYSSNNNPWTNQHQWAAAPCPYPSQPNSSSTIQKNQGILGPGPRPQAQNSNPSALTAHHYEYGPPMPLTDLGSAFHTMTLQQPTENWFIDTVASSHLTKNSGNISNTE